MPNTDLVSQMKKWTYLTQKRMIPNITNLLFNNSSSEDISTTIFTFSNTLNDMTDKVKYSLLCMVTRNHFVND